MSFGGASGSTVGGSVPLLLKDSEHSNTRSAVSEGTIIVRSAEGANDLVGLNRDTANANHKLDRPDQKAMQERIDLVQSTVQLASGVIATIAKAKADNASQMAKAAKTDAQIEAAKTAIADAASWNIGGDKRIMADIATGLLAAGLGGAGGATAVGIVANTTAADTFKKIGDYAETQKRNATDDVTRAAWAEGGAARVLLHALAGAAMGLSSGNVASGALGAGTSAALMPAIADALGKSGIKDTDQNALATLVATGLGVAAGSAEGASGMVAGAGSAVGVEVYNRQLHHEEEVAILAEVEKDGFKKENLDKATCFLTNCWAQFERGSPEYSERFLSEVDMVGLSNELAWADAQRDKGLFNYTYVDYVRDAMTRDIIPVGSSAGVVVAGGVGVYSGVTLCLTGGGCVVGGPMATFGVGNIVEGGSGIWNHVWNGESKSYNPIKEIFSEIPGGYGPIVYKGADLLLAGGAGFVRVPLKMGVADGLKSNSIFGVTVRGMDNNYFLPVVGTPTVYGTALVMYLKGVGGKALDFYSGIKSNE